MPKTDRKSDLTEKLPISHILIKILLYNDFISIFACDLSRSVCAKLFPIWTVAIDYLPAIILMARALVFLGFLSPSGA